MDRKWCLSHRSYAATALPGFLTGERASWLLEEQRLIPVFCFQHVHAIKVTSHDERHRYLVTDLAALTPADFLLRVAKIFRTPG